ncbi:hypothetical protein SETIT_9G547300v2 [Setaria italica]|uniref:Uncharacterized protein n=3 Tax=Setaria TaxID=4554 RepID=A0A368SW62_SETIT|nr:mitochondrial outer membrane protein porin 6 [Setaria italica]XP_034573002.1 mitochondrial outer membrane protein porin 6-like [Setaria viridis]RCV46635.1 hypothetical protein SETIT_9G547300v2 [Setaria italica]
MWAVVGQAPDSACVALPVRCGIPNLGLCLSHCSQASTAPPVPSLYSSPTSPPDPRSAAATPRLSRSRVVEIHLDADRFSPVGHWYLTKFRKMSKGPVPFGNIGKRAKDLLYKDYNFDQKFSLSTSSSSGLNLTATGVRINEDFIGDIRTQHKSGRTTVDVIIDSDSKVSTTVTVDEALTGLKTSFSFKVPDHKSVKLDLQYAHNRFALNSTIGLTSAPLVELAATVGTSELSFGAEVGFDSTSASVTKYNSGIGYNKPDFSASLLLADKGETLKASYIHLFNPTNGATVAAEVTHKLKTKENYFTIGSSHALDSSTSLKTRFSNSGKVGLLCQHEWRPKSLVTLSAEYDPKVVRSPSRFGVAISVKP